ncbi:MAG: hypothetical protein LBE91_08985 [Tannerella sp.]|jgi:hypothetical protein|nr:hypothetical protein [Tannerella sp.]
MKKLLFLLTVVLFAACDNDENLVTYQVNEPVMMTEAEFRSSVNVTTTSQRIENYGKICFYNGYLYISEPGEGIHIIDNRNPSSPAQVGFIELLGNADIAVKNDLLYADALIDLVWFDITNPAQPELTGRLENVFPEAVPMAENNYAYDYSNVYTVDGKRKGVLVGWTLAQRVTPAESYSNETGWWNFWGGRNDGLMFAEAATPSANKSSSGVNGSMSRFALYDKYLYCVINYQMQIFDLSTEKPEKVSGEDLYIGNVETIFSYKDNMFLGMPTGMSIYSVKDPTRPERCSTITHVLGCDPVVVDNDLAYVTVHSGNFCGQNNDELFIVDVKDVYQPRQLVSFTMVNPKGLGIDSEKQTLFLCDDGLKVFKIGDNPQTLISNQLAHIQGMDGFDLIPYDNVLMMIADDGLYQYDYSDIQSLKKLSVIPVYKNENQ